MDTKPLTFLFLLAATAPVAAQTLLLRSSTAPLLDEIEGGQSVPPVPLQVLPGGWGGYPGVPPPSPLPFPLEAPKAASVLFGPPTAFPLGDLAFDNLRGLIFETDGHRVGVHVHEAFVPPGSVPSVQVSPATPWLGPLTGLAVDPATQRLWCTDGAYFCATSATSPTTALSLPAGFGFSLAAPPMTGLDWDGRLSLLIGCDAGGNVYRFTTAGVAAGPQPWIAAGTTSFGGPATDVAVPHMPVATTSFHAWLQVLGAGVFTHEGSVWGPWLPSLVPPGTEAGLALVYTDLPDLTYCGCPHGSFRPTMPTVIGQAQAGLALHDLPPGTPAFLLLTADRSVFAPGLLPGQPPCFYRLLVSPMAEVFLGAVAGSDGRAVFPVPLTIPTAWAGLLCYAQSAFLCPGPDLFGVSSRLDFQLGLP